MLDDATETFDEIMHSLKGLDANELFQRPERGDASALSKRSSVLVVEDQMNERELLVGVLRLNGFDVFSAGDGEQALDVLASHTPPNVILMDMNLPRCNGPETVRRIRRSDRHGDTNVFAISGSSPEECCIEAGARGVNRWFPKPLNIDDLIEALASVSVSREEMKPCQ